MRRYVTGIVAGALLATTGLGLAASSAAPKTNSPPTLEGVFRDGQTLTAGNGLWLNSPTAYAYQWHRCDSNGNGCSPIAGQIAKTYKLTQTDVGGRIKVWVTASNADGSSAANSLASPLISDDVPPRNTREPAIRGGAQVGATLTADDGSWTGGPVLSRQWHRCDANGNNCTAVTGATGSTYGVRYDDVGRRLRLAVTAKNDLAAVTALSNPTGVVPAAGAAATAASVVNIATVALPDRLVISAVQWLPSVVRSRSVPVIGRFRVTDTKGLLVSGALVYATGLPFGRVAEAPEVATDSTGWATITFVPSARMPLRAGATLTFFVRARKPGDDVLAGVSTRRLVQVRIDPTS